MPSFRDGEMEKSRTCNLLTDKKQVVSFVKAEGHHESTYFASSQVKKKMVANVRKKSRDS